MERCDDLLVHLVDLAEGRAVPESVARHIETCDHCRHELEWQKSAAAYLSREAGAPALDRPFLVPAMARQRDRRLLGAAGAVLFILFLGMHSLLDLEPVLGLLGSFQFLGPFSQNLFQHVGWGAVAVLLGLLGGLLWGLKRALQRV